MPGFIDAAQVHVKAGDGGAGSVSFRREAHVARGGPDGGDGGHGGDVYLEASTDVVSLLAFADHPHRRADDGGHGSGQKRHGRSGRDLIVPVPEGTVVRSLDGDVVADLAHSGDRLLAAEHGRGGRGNARFLSNKLRAPAFAEQGEFGQERWLDLELKLLADAALVGFPNVGKSTLISRISAARPKIADYPFTTLEPHLGVVRVGSSEDVTEFTVADIPGLVEGASDGRGLGIEFLRHIERARVLVVLLDCSPFAERSPTEQAEILLFELGRYRRELLDRPRLVVGSRADLAEGDAVLPEGAGLISSVTGAGIPELLGQLAATIVDERRLSAVPRGEPVVHRPAPEGFVVERVDGDLVVTGRQVARAVALSDLNDAAAAELVARRLRRLGVDRALRRGGARTGDTVHIGGHSFEWTADGDAAAIAPNSRLREDDGS